MTTERHQRIRRIFHAATEMDEAERTAYLTHACGSDDSLRKDVESLLRLDTERTDAFDEQNLGIGPRLLGSSLQFGQSDKTSDNTPLHGQFLPGTMISDRFRIVSLLGRGGMGEVYRADDLRLGQSVALKFLPSDVANQSGLLEHLRNEVKLSREVAHPNVCRVYDLQEEGGHHFLSMEYVDGEDLRSLLLRIGRLPRDRGIDVARQLCLGLAAAHERAVLHRDLKPANVMIDGRGCPKITDFGLARVGKEPGNSREWLGTPAYMAPEQLSSGITSEQSDLYSLGLILYEVFTGCPANQASAQVAPALPSSLVHDLDPTVEHAIMQCLSDDPSHRPRSARDIVAGLPGSDALEAAIEAGQVPSVDMIVALGDEQKQSISLNALCLALVLLGVAASIMLSLVSQRVIGFHVDSLDQVHVSRRIIEDLGYSAQPFDYTWGVGWDPSFFEFVEDDEKKSAWKRITGAPPTAATFWYRQHTKNLVPESGRRHFAAMFVTPDDPPPWQPGMIGLLVDAQGRLLEWRAVPGAETGDAASDRPENWRAALLRCAGIDENAWATEFSRLAKIDSAPPVFATDWEIWQSSSNLQVELAGYEGRPVYFRIGYPLEKETKASSRVFGFFLIVTMAVIFSVAIRMAWKNWFSGRADRRGAARLLMFVLSSSFLYWACQAHHVVGPGEMVMILETIARALLRGVIICAAYVGLEPYVRRMWPNTLVGWNRLMTGGVRDPLVGRAILMGAVGGVAAQLVGSMWLAMGIPRQISLAADPVLGVSIGPFPLRPLLGPHVAIGQISRELMVSLVCGFVATLLFIYVLRTALRKEWLAYLAFVSFFAAPSVVSEDYVAACTIGFWAALAIVLLFQFGVLTVVIAWIVWQILSWPITIDPTAPHVDIGLMGYLVVVGLACCGFLWSRRVVTRPE